MVKAPCKTQKKLLILLTKLDIRFSLVYIFILKNQSTIAKVVYLLLKLADTWVSKLFPNSTYL